MRVSFACLALLALTSTTRAQDSSPPDSTGLPGDGFSLAGALDLFRQAKDLAAFEQALNQEANKVNNLDLDGDGQVDYIRVVGHRDGDAQAIVMQVPLSKEELQDVAVIELEKKNATEARLQIRGAEELYGTDVMMEPVAEEDAGTEPSKGPSAPELVRIDVWVNVWDWPCVGFLYAPNYVGWNSPWFWSYYPPWWQPWRPMGMNAWMRWYRTYHHLWYRPIYTCNVMRAHEVYRPRAMYSPSIQRSTAPIREQRATMRTAPTDHRVTPGSHPNERPADRRSPKVQDKGNRTPSTRPAERAPRTQPKPKQPSRTAPVQDTPKSPAPTRSPEPARSPGKR